MRAYVGAAESMHSSCACIFVDAINAFATLWARSAVVLPTCDEHCVASLIAIGLPLDEIHSILSDARRHAEWGCAPTHLTATVSAFQAHAWAARDFDVGVLTTG